MHFAFAATARRLADNSFCAAVLLAGTTAGLGTVGPAVAGTPRLDLGVSTLPEQRTTETLGPGVELTQIIRGTGAATSSQIATTTRGPWRVNVVRIDPRTATGHLAATYGADLARTETTSALTSAAGALAGVNSSYFTYTKNPTYPGDPVGLGLYDGQLLSEPAATSTEVDVLVDATTNKVRLGRLTWSGSVRNRTTGATLALTRLNSPPVVPSGCTTLSDPTRCTKAGAVVRFVPAFAAATPKGRGVEVVLDAKGCVVSTAKSRGRTLMSTQTSVQATGRQAKTLLALAKKGCLSTSLALRDAKGAKVELHAGLYGVAGRYRLVQDGHVVVPSKKEVFFDRHPRTFVGTTKAGVVALVTIDGTQATSVGATLKEAAAVAVSLGITDAVNLDGGGSTTMVAGGQVVNRPSHGAERAVGDALVYVGHAAG